MLRQRLPLELVEMIMRKTHELNFQDSLNTIKYNLIWIRHEGEYSFLLHETQNYYEKLIQWEDGEPVPIHSYRARS